jgi:hypothetical protein
MKSINDRIVFTPDIQFWMERLLRLRQMADPRNDRELYNFCSVTCQNCPYLNCHCEPYAVGRGNL